jgi:hypothetical protein
MALVSCACLKYDNSAVLDASISSSVASACGPTASAQMSGALYAFGAYCSMAGVSLGTGVVTGSTAGPIRKSLFTFNRLWEAMGSLLLNQLVRYFITLTSNVDSHADVIPNVGKLITDGLSKYNFYSSAIFIPNLSAILLGLIIGVVIIVGFITMCYNTNLRRYFARCLRRKCPRPDRVGDTGLSRISGS